MKLVKTLLAAILGLTVNVAEAKEIPIINSEGKLVYIESGADAPQPETTDPPASQTETAVKKEQSKEQQVPSRISINPGVDSSSLSHPMYGDVDSNLYNVSLGYAYSLRDTIETTTGTVTKTTEELVGAQGVLLEGGVRTTNTLTKSYGPHVRFALQRRKPDYNILFSVAYTQNPEEVALGHPADEITAEFQLKYGTGIKLILEGHAHANIKEFLQDNESIKRINGEGVIGGGYSPNKNWDLEVLVRHIRHPHLSLNANSLVARAEYETKSFDIGIEAAVGEAKGVAGHLGYSFTNNFGVSGSFKYADEAERKERSGTLEFHFRD